MKAAATLGMVVTSTALLLTACSGPGWSGNLFDFPLYSIGATVQGLAGSGLVLQGNGETQAIGRAANGNYVIAIVSPGTKYDVTVQTQPTEPSQTCVVTNGSGTIGSADVTNIQVTCTTPASRFAYLTDYGSNSISAYSIDVGSGTLTPLGGSPLQLCTGFALFAAAHWRRSRSAAHWWTGFRAGGLAAAVYWVIALAVVRPDRQLDTAATPQ